MQLTHNRLCLRTTLFLAALIPFDRRDSRLRDEPFGTMSYQMKVEMHRLNKLHGDASGNQLNQTMPIHGKRDPILQNNNETVQVNSFLRDCSNCNIRSSSRQLKW